MVEQEAGGNGAGDGEEGERGESCAGIGLVVEGKRGRVEEGETLVGSGLEEKVEITRDEEYAAWAASDVAGEVAVAGIGEEILAWLGAWRDRFGLFGEFGSGALPASEFPCVFGMLAMNVIGVIFLARDERSEKDTAGEGEAGIFARERMADQILVGTVWSSLSRRRRVLPMAEPAMVSMGRAIDAGWRE